MGVLFRSLAGWFISFVRKSPLKKKNMDLGLPPWIGNLQIWCIWDPWYGKTPFWIATPPSSSMFDAFDHHPGEFHQCWMTGWWWLEPWNFSWLSIQLGSSIHPNWRTPSFFTGIGIPPTSFGSLIFRGTRLTWKHPTFDELFIQGRSYAQSPVYKVGLQDSEICLY